MSRSETSAAIDLDGVTKRFGGVTAVDDLDLTVREGEIYGFLGPNGAGKSTTINVLLDFARPTEGTVRALGDDVQRHMKRVRRRLGVLPDGYDVYERLTGRQHVEFEIDAKGAGDDPDELLARVGLSPEAADRKAGGYSKGMTQRLALAMALVGDPDLLILDEPSTGLDPTGVKEMRDLVLEENERGTTVFFSSHILGQVEEVCDRVGILVDGSLVAEDSIDGLRERANLDSVLELTLDALGAIRPATVEEMAGVSGAAVEDGVMAEVIAAVDERTAVERVRTGEASLEDLFVEYAVGDGSTASADGRAETGGDSEREAEVSP